MEWYKWLFDGVGGGALVALGVMFLQRLITPKESLHVPENPHPSAPFPRTQPAGFAQPELKFGLAEGTVEVFDTCVGFAKSGGHRCNVIVVHNEAAAAGEDAPVARAISARLTFSPFGSSRTTFVDRACWIGRVENQISLRPGDTEHVLLRIAKDNEWITYENPNKHNSGGWPLRNQDLREVKFPVFPNTKVTGEISIIAHQSQSATTLATRKFAITFDHIGLFVNIEMEGGA